MFFDAQQTLEAVKQVERPRPAPKSSPNLLPLLVGILIGRKSK